MIIDKEWDGEPDTSNVGAVVPLGKATLTGPVAIISQMAADFELLPDSDLAQVEYTTQSAHETVSHYGHSGNSLATLRNGEAHDMPDIEFPNWKQPTQTIGRPRRDRRKAKAARAARRRNRRRR